MSTYNFINLTGQRFGRLKVIERAPNKIGSKKVRWLCKCDCGDFIDTLGDSLKRGDTISCGCFRKEITSQREKLRPYETLYNHFIRTNKDRCSCELSYEDFVAFTSIKKCHYCNKLVEWAEIGSGGYNLDRKDSMIGYTKANCVVCCKRCNYGKNDLFTYYQWLLIGEFIKSKPDIYGEEWEQHLQS